MKIEIDPNKQQKTGSIVDDTITVRTDGGARTDFTIKAPSWANVSGTATTDIKTLPLTYDVYVDGKLATSGTISATDLVDVPGGYQVNRKTILGSGYLDAGEKVTSVVLTNLEWAEANVEYTLNGKPLDIDKDLDGALKTATVGTAEGIVIEVKGIAATSDGKYEITGLTAATSGNQTDLATQATVAGCIAKGDEPVVVKLTATVTKKFSVAVGAGATGKALPTYEGVSDNGIITPETAVLTVTATSTNIGEDQSAVISVALDKAPTDAGVYAYEVYVLGQKATLKDANAKTITIPAPNKDLTIELDDIEIKPVERPRVLTAEWNKNTLTMHFSAPIKVKDSTPGVGGVVESNLTAKLEDGGLTLVNTITELSGGTPKNFAPDDPVYDGLFTNNARYCKADDPDIMIASQTVWVLADNACKVDTRTSSHP